MESSTSDGMFNHRKFFEDEVLKSCPKAVVEKLYGVVNKEEEEESRDKKLIQRFMDMYNAVFIYSHSASPSTEERVGASGRTEDIVQRGIDKYRQAIRDQLKKYGVARIDGIRMKFAHETGVKAARSLVVDAGNPDCDKMLEVLQAGCSLEYSWIKIMTTKKKLWPTELAITRILNGTRRQAIGIMDTSTECSCLWFYEPEEINPKLSAIMDGARKNFLKDVRSKLKLDNMKDEGVACIEASFERGLTNLRKEVLRYNDGRRDNAMDAIMKAVDVSCAMFYIHMDALITGKPLTTLEELEKEKEEILRLNLKLFFEDEARNRSEAFQRKYSAEMRKGYDKMFSIYVSARVAEVRKIFEEGQAGDVEGLSKAIENFIIADLD